MHNSASETRSEVLTTQDFALLRTLEPRQLAVKYVFDVLSLSTIAGGVVRFSSGDWSHLADPVFFLGAPAAASLGTAFHVWSSRKLLRSTAGETRAQVARDWRFFTGRGWTLRLAGVAAGLSALFVTFASVLAAIVEPLPTVGAAALEFLRLFALGFGLLLPVMLLVGLSFRRALRNEIGLGGGAYGTHR